MYLKYGSYTHQFCECSVTISKLPIYTGNYVRIGHSETWSIRGRLVGDSEADIKTKIQALETAYATDRQDVYLLQADGSTSSAHYIISSATLSGLLVKRFAYPNGEDITSGFRNYEIELSTQVDTSAGGGGGGAGGQQIVSYSESISSRGTGGPRIVARETRNGTPVMQTVSQFTPVYVTQRGSSVGLFGYPNAPGPIWPQYEQVADRDITYTAPEQVLGSGSGQESRRFTTSWSYSFVASGAIAGKPGGGF